MVTKDKMTRCLITFSQLVYMENAEENMNFDNGTQRVKKIQARIIIENFKKHTPCLPAAIFESYFVLVWPLARC